MSAHPGHHPAVPPIPGETDDMQRWEHTRLRRRMLSGRWAPDLESRYRAHFGILRRGIIGPKSLAKNSFRKLCHELGVNYNEAPTGRDRAGTDAPQMFGREGLLAQVGLWPMMRRVQAQLIGLREYVLDVDYSDELRRPAVRMVPPDGVLAWAHDSAPTVPVEMWRLRWREVDGKGMWAWDQASIADRDRPFFRIVEAKLTGATGADVTDRVLGRRLEGGSYPYRWTRGPRAGEPWLKFVLYHAMHPEQLWDPYEGIEVVDGSLDVATAYGFLNHSIFKASWPQRWALGAYVAGVAPRDSAAGARSEVPTDPTSLLHLEVAQAGTQPQIGQWGPGMDVESLARTVTILERATADFDGLDSSHIVVDTANPMSAAALSITREGKRAAQERYKISLLPSDLETVSKLACIANLEAWGPGYDEEGYSIEYRLLPLSAGEAESKRKHHGELIAQGRMSTVDAYMAEHPGLSRDEAIRDLERIAAENKRLGVQPGTQPTPVVAGGAPTPTETPGASAGA